MALVAMVKRGRWLWLLWSRGEGGLGGYGQEGDIGCYGQEVRVALVAMVKRGRWLWLLWSRGEGGFGCYGQEGKVALVAMVKRGGIVCPLWVPLSYLFSVYMYCTFHKCVTFLLCVAVW